MPTDCPYLWPLGATALSSTRSCPQVAFGECALVRDFDLQSVLSSPRDHNAAGGPVVYSAKATRRDGRAAIKIRECPSAHGSVPAGEVYFLQRAQGHGNIVGLLDAFYNPWLSVLVMELLDYSALMLVQSSSAGCLAETTAKYIFAQHWPRIRSLAWPRYRSPRFSRGPHYDQVRSSSMHACGCRAGTFGCLYWLR